jgi:hypothetical protein
VASRDKKKICLKCTEIMIIRMLESQPLEAIYLSARVAEVIALAQNHGQAAKRRASSGSPIIIICLVFEAVSLSRLD